MPRSSTDVTTTLATHTKVALGFIVATAAVVLLSAVATLILTFVARPVAPAASPTDDRTFVTR